MIFPAVILAIAALSRVDHGTMACPPPPPPCEALQQASIVLLADVLEAEHAAELIAPNPLAPQRVRLKVIERFKGVAREQREVTARIWYDSNSVLLEKGKP